MDSNLFILGSFLEFRTTIYVRSLVRDLHSHKIASGKQEALMDFPQQHDINACGQKLVQVHKTCYTSRLVCLPQIKDKLAVQYNLGHLPWVTMYSSTVGSLSVWCFLDL